MFDASGGSQETARALEPRVAGGGTGFLYHFGLNLGRTARILANAPAAIARGAGRSITRIGALARKKGQDRVELQERTPESPPQESANDGAAAPPPTRGRRASRETDGALDEKPDLNGLDVRVGSEKKDG